MKGLIWQDDENIIDVVYQTIYGLPVKEAMHVVELYEAKQLIPIEWIEEWGWKNGMSESMSLRVMIDDWEKENENNSD